MLNKTLSILMVLMLGMYYGSTPPNTPPASGSDSKRYLGTPDDANTHLAWLRIYDNLDPEAKQQHKFQPPTESQGTNRSPGDQ